MSREPTVVELRVATAIHWIGGEVDSADVLEAARDAIRAMRTPTPEMLDAYMTAIPGFEISSEGRRQHHQPKAIKRYAAMIDAASPEEEP